MRAAMAEPHWRRDHTLPHRIIGTADPKRARILKRMRIHRGAGKLPNRRAAHGDNGTRAARSVASPKRALVASSSRALA